MEETNTVSTAVDTDSWDDIDFSDVFDTEEPATEQKEDETASTDTATEEEANPAETEAVETPAEAKTETKESEEANHSFVLKYMGEEKEFSREDTIALAQKGMDYDRVKDKLSEANQLAESNAEAAEFVKFMADSMGVDPAEFMLSAKAGSLSKKEGISLEEAKGRLRLEAREKSIAAREKALEEKAKAEKQESDAQAQRLQQLTDFMKAYPTVKAADIPQEVFQKAHKEGIPLVAAYAMHEAAAAKAELETARQNAENAKASVGSASTSGKHQTVDEFDASWYDGT